MTVSQIKRMAIHRALQRLRILVSRNNRYRVLDPHHVGTGSLLMSGLQSGQRIQINLMNDISGQGSIKYESEKQFCTMPVSEKEVRDNVNK